MLYSTTHVHGFFDKAFPSRPPPPPAKLYLQPPPNSQKASPAGEGGLAEGLRRLFQGPQKPENKKAKTITSAPPAHLHSNAAATDVDAAAPPKPKGKPPQPRRLRVDLVLYSGGRDANSETLGCAEAGVELARYGRIKASYAPAKMVFWPTLTHAAIVHGGLVLLGLFLEASQSCLGVEKSTCIPCGVLFSNPDFLFCTGCAAFLTAYMALTLT